MGNSRTFDEDYLKFRNSDEERSKLRAECSYSKYKSKLYPEDSAYKLYSRYINELWYGYPKRAVELSTGRILTNV